IRSAPAPAAPLLLAVKCLTAGGLVPRAASRTCLRKRLYDNRRMSEATKQLNKAAAPEGGPGGRRGGHMPAAEYCAGLLRYLAGEPLAQVAAETGRSVSSYYRQARNMGLRKRDLGIPTRRK